MYPMDEESAVAELMPLAVSNVEGRSELSAAWWAVISRFLLHGLVVSTWVSCIPAIQSSLKLTNAHLGLCLLGTAIGSVLTTPVTGWLVTRYGSKRTAAWSTVGFSAALAFLSMAGSAEQLFAGLMIFGAMAAANDVSINAQGVAVERAMATPTMSRFHAMFSIGGMIGASVGGLVAAHGIAPRLHMTAASVLFAIISMMTAPFLFDAQDNAGRRSKLSLAGGIPMTLITLAAIGFCMFLSEGAIADWTGVYLKQTLNASAGLAATGYAIFSTGMAIFRLLGDSITARLGPVRTVRAGALLAAGGLLLALTAPSPMRALPGFALTGAGFSVIVPLVFGAGGRVGSVASGAGVAVVSGSGYIGFLFGPPLIGLVAQHSSLRVALFLILGLSLLAAALASAVRVQGERI